MNYLILVRHGQSIWNLEKRFTGWVDIDLTDKGKFEAEKAGILIKERKISLDLYYSSYQKRANNTLKIIQKVMGDNKNFTRAWELNERHYGSLTGLNKIEMMDKLGEDRVHEFRRSWDTKPEPLDRNSIYHPNNINTYNELPRDIIPDTESLKNTYERVVNYFKKEINEKLKIKKNILVSAHGNSIRALCKYLFKLDNKQISKLEIPTGNPLIIKFSENNEIIDCEYLDKERSKSLLVF